MDREFIFNIQELKEGQVSDSIKMKETIKYHSGFAVLKEDATIEVFVDDLSQQYGMFKSKDKIFNKVFKKIVETIKGKSE